MNAKKTIIIVIFAFIGWIACGATMGIGMALTTLDITLKIHAIGAPVYFSILSFLYFKKFNYTNPLITAIVFLGFVILVDFFFIALVINQSLDMFHSILGTWLPFILIFLATLITGELVVRFSSPALKNDDSSDL